jgi:hypothetical protein
MALLVLAAMGVSAEAIGATLKWGWIGLMVYLVGFIVFGKIDDARHHARAQRRQQERASRERQAAHEKRRVDEAAQAVLQAERERRVSAPRRVREALDAVDIHEAHEICRQCAWDADIVATEWRDDGSGGLVSWSQLSPPPDDGSVDEARLMRFSRAERDAMLNGVIASLVEAAGANQGDEERATCALLALSGFGDATGDADSIRRRVARLLHGVVWNPASSQQRRVTALVALGAFGSETGADTDSPTPPSEPMGDYLSDDDPEVRSAASFAIGLRLLPWADTDARDAAARETDANLPDDVRRDMEDVRRADAERGRLYVAVAAGLLRPLLDGDPDTHVRATVAGALASVEDGAVRASLRKRATDPDEAEEVRRAATTALQAASRAVLTPLSNELAYLQRYASRSKARSPQNPSRRAGQGAGQSAQATVRTAPRRTRGSQIGGGA